MTEGNLSLQLKGLEAQLAVLKARLSRQSGPSPKSFADLHGLLAGKADTSEEEIEGAKYCPKWEHEDEEQSRE